MHWEGDALKPCARNVSRRSRPKTSYSRKLAFAIAVVVLAPWLLYLTFVPFSLLALSFGLAAAAMTLVVLAFVILMLRPLAAIAGALRENARAAGETIMSADDIDAILEGVARLDAKAGMISPALFVPILEDANLAGEIGMWTLNAACREARNWQRRGIDGLKVAVNLSATQLRDPNLKLMIQRTLERHQLRPEALELELTETAATEDADRSSHLPSL